jgi:hypothetical protein
VPLRLVFHSPLSPFRDLVVATENLVAPEPLGSCLVSAFLPMNPDDCELIEVHMFSSFCPISLGIRKRVAAAPNEGSAFLGDRKNFVPAFKASCEHSTAQNCLVDPKKAERTPVPGAGLSPDAVPEKAGQTERSCRTRQPAMWI